MIDFDNTPILENIYTRVRFEGYFSRYILTPFFIVRFIDLTQKFILEHGLTIEINGSFIEFIFNKLDNYNHQYIDYSNSLFEYIIFEFAQSYNYRIHDTHFVYAMICAIFNCIREWFKENPNESIIMHKSLFLEAKYAGFTDKNINTNKYFDIDKDYIISCNSDGYLDLK